MLVTILRPTWYNHLSCWNLMKPSPQVLQDLTVVPMFSKGLNYQNSPRSEAARITASSWAFVQCLHGNSAWFDSPLVFTVRGISGSNKPVLHHGASLLYKLVLPLCLPQWAGKLVVGEDSPHLGYFLSFRGFMSQKVWLKIIWNWNLWSRKSFLLTWAHMDCIRVTDPSRTLPVSWVRITEAQFDTAQRASPKPCSAQGQGTHKRRLPVLTQCGQAPFLRACSLQCAKSQWNLPVAEGETRSS